MGRRAGGIALLISGHADTTKRRSHDWDQTQPYGAHPDLQRLGKKVTKTLDVNIPGITITQAG